ncbi:tyrosine-protein phosphatase [Rhodococcus koreensis]|uniref:tyrosine-protein phosphatase n=1 Tax=Rhodococcus koreensis TaxID=99653 RepID=UPI0036714112
MCNSDQATRRHGSHTATLRGAWNFRDVGGMHVSGGGALQNGILFRSSALSLLDPEGVDRLVTLNVKNVFDLRGAREVAKYGSDRVPVGTLVHSHPFERGVATVVPHVLPIMTSDRERIAYMEATYRKFATLDGAGRAIRRVVSAVIDRSHDAVLVHCAAGKDRTGWVVGAVLRAAGVPDQAVVDDFLVSNDAVEYLREVQRRHSLNADLSELVLGVRESYFLAAVDTVTNLHGSFDAYLDTIGVHAGVRVELRRALVGEG